MLGDEWRGPAKELLFAEVSLIEVPIELSILPAGFLLVIMAAFCYFPGLISFSLCLAPLS